jgi:hypothetical protein
VDADVTDPGAGMVRSSRLARAVIRFISVSDVPGAACQWISRSLSRSVGTRDRPTSSGSTTTAVTIRSATAAYSLDRTMDEAGQQRGVTGLQPA